MGVIGGLVGGIVGGVVGGGVVGVVIPPDEKGNKISKNSILESILPSLCEAGIKDNIVKCNTQLPDYPRF